MAASNLIPEAVVTPHGTIKFAADTDGTGKDYPKSKLVWGPDGTFTDVDTGAGLPVTEASAAGIKTDTATIAGDTTSLDAKVAAATTDDLDSGAGTDTVVVRGIALPGSGGHVVGGTATNPLRTDPTGTTTQPVSGTVTADAGSGPWPVTDNGGLLSVDDGAGSLTVDAPVAAPVNVQVGDGTDTVAVSAGGSLQVDVSAALPAGTNAIGKLAANSGVDIGDVDVLSLPDQNQTQAKWDTSNSDATGLTASYATKLTTTNVTTIRGVKVVYTGDQPIVLSFDGANDHAHVAPYESTFIDLYALGLKETGDVSAKHDGTVPNVGRLFLTAVGV